MAIGAGRPRVDEPDPDGFSSFVVPIPQTWGPVVDEHVRLASRKGVLGSLPKITFDAERYVINVAGLPVFRPRPHTLLLHLAHPLIQKTLSVLSRMRYPGATGHSASRWTLSTGPVPAGADCLLRLTLEELAINELRETFHHWVRTVQIPVRNGRLLAPLAHQPAAELSLPSGKVPTSQMEAVEDLWIAIEPEVKGLIRERTDQLNKTLLAELESDRKRAAEDAVRRYQSRHGEVSSLIENLSMTRLEKEIADLKALQQQGVLFDAEQYLQRLEQDIELKERELKLRKQRYEDVRQQLAVERERILTQLIPRRYSLRGHAQAVPVAVEFILPQGGAL
jgi:hypothetical protein